MVARRPWMDNMFRPQFTCFGAFETSKGTFGLGFRLVTDVRDPSAGLPMRQPNDGMPLRQAEQAHPEGARRAEAQPEGTQRTRRFDGDLPSGPGAEDLPARHRGAKRFRAFDTEPEHDTEQGSREEPAADASAAGAPERQPLVGARQQRRPALRPPRPSGRHRRPVPASLPEAAPALVLAVPGSDTDLTSGPVAELTAILRVDNPALDVRSARIDDGGRTEPNGIRAVLADAAARRPAGIPCAVVIPLIATPNPALVRRLREVVAASDVNVIISGFINSNALIAEALHIRLAEAGLARADRVRMFSIVTAADGIIVATVGGPDAAMAANVTSVLLAARLALPIIPVSLDSAPSLQEGAMRLKEMGVNRMAIAPCFIGPEASHVDIDVTSIGAECAAPLGAHGNIAKLAAVTYGQAISQLEFPGEQA
jgi:hypothetical protein